MQRRPLEPLPLDPDIYRPWFYWLYFLARMPADEIKCTCPLYRAQNYNELFKLLGFIEEIPVHPKTKKQMKYPINAPDGEHTTGFLQFGVQMISLAQAIFELGDHSRIIRVEFRENWPEGYEDRDPFYQLDEITIWDGDIRYSLDCECEDYEASIQESLNVAKDVVRGMWEQLSWEEIKQRWDALSLVIRELDSLNERLDREFSAEMAGSGQHLRP